MAFLYNLLLKLLYPTSVSLLLMCLGLVWRKWRQVCLLLAVLVLVVCGNGFLVSRLIRHLERQHLPPTPTPAADAIVVLSGGVYSRTPPRQSVEIGDAGDRLLFGAELYREGKAPHIIVTGNVASSALAPRPAAEDMAELLQIVGVPTTAIVKELQSENTREHAANLCPVFRERGFGRVLLVTSALHMPRSVGVFRRLCPAVEFIPAPTDFRTVDEPDVPWYRQSQRLLPTPRTLLDFSDAAHEYVGIAYYQIRGWI